MTHFIRARNQAINEVLPWTHPEWLIQADKETVEFYRLRRKQIVEELQKSPLELRNSNPNKKCGQTELKPLSKIWLSKTECDDILERPLWVATELLINEAVHHFGKADQFSAALAVAVIDGFRRGIPLEGRWINSIRSKFINTIHIEREGEALAVTSDWELFYRRKDNFVNPWLKKVTKWDRFRGILYVSGEFYSISRLGRKCTFPAGLEIDVNLTGTKMKVVTWSPKTLNHDTCAYFGEGGNTYTFVRKLAPPAPVTFKDYYPWRYLFSTYEPAYRKIKGVPPWDYIYGEVK